MLGCRGGAEDSIEHYCRCPVTKKVLERKLNMSPTKYAHLHSFLLCNTYIRTQDELTSIALLIYALYNATNYYRHNPPAPDVNVHEAVTQWMREGAKNHRNATHALDNRWNPTRHDKPIPPIPLHI